MAGSILPLVVFAMMSIIHNGGYLQELVGKWADPGGTAMPGQPVTRPEQAPGPYPLAKISLINMKGGT